MAGIMTRDAAEAGRYIAGMSGIREMIDRIPEDREQLVCFGEIFPSSAERQQLETEIRKILADNHQVSLVMVNLPAKSGVAFRPTIPMCAQSTVKAIYVGAVLDFYPMALTEHRREIRDAIVLSSNEAYLSLRNVYGTEPIRAWCRETGVDEGFAGQPFPRAYAARDMLKLWTRLYCFLNNGSDGAGAGGYYTDSALSAAKERLGDRCPVQTKAGWENGIGDDSTDYEYAAVPPRYLDGDPLNDECATNDSGIIYSDRGPYLFVIYSDYPWPWSGSNRLYGLTEALYKIRFEKG